MNNHIVSGWIKACKSYYTRYNFLKKCSLDDRLYRLFGVACCRETWNELTDEQSKKAVETAELYADGLITKEELQKAQDDAWSILNNYTVAAAYTTNIFAETAAYHTTFWVASTVHEYIQQGLILASMCPMTFNDNWVTPTTKSLAHNIYDNKDFSLMPILTDALQDVNCGKEILNHLRSPGPFYKGNYIIDRLIGKR